MLQFLIVLVYLYYFVFGFFFEGLFLTDFFHVGDFFSWHIFVQLTVFPQLVHHLKHVVLEAEGSISLAFEVDLHYHAIAVDVDPPDIPKLNVDLVVKSSVYLLLLESVTSRIDEVKLVFVVWISFENKNGVFLNKLSFLEVDVEH